MHELIHNQAKVSLGAFPPFLVVITALAGTLLSAAGGRLARGQRGAERRQPPAGVATRRKNRRRTEAKE